MSVKDLPRPVVLLAGFAVGALVTLLLPGSWLFRDPPVAEHARGIDDRRWACPMFCTMADAPGDCPVCGMEMEPVKDQGQKVALGKRERYMAGVRTAVARREQALYRVRALGRIQPDERLEGQITAWVSGRLDKLYVDFTGVTVKAGDKVAEIYAPELLSAQEELISAVAAHREAERASGARAKELMGNAHAVYVAARRRLSLLGLPDDVLDTIEKDGKARVHLEIHANVGGTVLRKNVNTGDYVKTGAPLFSVVDLDHVWAMLEVFEEDAGAVFVGQKVEITVPSLPGEIFRGEISFVDPVLDTHKRVVNVRVDLPNEHGRLKPGAFTDAEILVELTAEGKVHAPQNGTVPGPVLLIPRSAVLDGGDRRLTYVMTQEPGPEKDGQERWPAVYEPREIEVGFRIGDDVVVLAGLAPDEAVVMRGQFLIDSQLQLTGKPSLMIPEAAGAAADPHAHHKK